jgi:segregation and condensation protein B
MVSNTKSEPIENLIEAILFFKGGSLSVKELTSALDLSTEETEKYIGSLAMSLEGRGLTLVREKNQVALGTAPAARAIIEKMRRDELEGPLGKAGLETLAIIIFRGPLPRADIEYVRGVNCSSILRSLLIRGLIERVDNPTDKRSFLYQSTPELPAFLGVSKLDDIPGYADTKAGIEKIFEERATADVEREMSESVQPTDSDIQAEES